MNKHQERHAELHGSLDELVACFILSTKRSLRETSVMDLIEWSNQATQSVETCKASFDTEE